MTVVYELPDYAPPFPINHGTIAFLFIFVILMAGFVVMIRFFQAEMHRPALLNKSLKRLRVGYWALILVGVVAFSAIAGLMGMTYVSRKQEYDAIVVAYRNGDYEVIEGPVENLKPRPREGHAAESFEVGGVLFEYPIGYTYCYDKTYYEGGVFRWEGKNVRIGYITYKGDNLIVRIEEP